MKRSLLISGLIATAVTVFGAAGITSGELDLPGLNQRIDNIDARTTNNEQDIQALQTATQTTPAPHVPVPVAPTPVVTSTVTTLAAPSTPAPTPQPTVATTPSPTPCLSPVIDNPSGAPNIGIVGPTCNQENPELLSPTQPHN